MSETKDLAHKLENIFEQVAKKKHIKNYKINFKLTEQVKNGFSSEMYFGSIVDQNSGVEYFLVLKKQFDYNHSITPGMYEKMSNKVNANEIYFYETFIPTFKKFQKDKNLTNPFHEVAKCFLTQSPPKACLVFENVTAQGFKMWDKTVAFPKQYLELIFKTYGKFHGMSFAMRDQNPEDYEKLVRNFDNLSEDPIDWGLTRGLDKIYEEIKNSNEFAAEKLNKYILWDTGEQAKLKYNGKNKCIVHGDCWSNNMLFKYSEGDINKVHDIRLIDFQQISEDTPIHDLSYFFYSGGVKEDFDNLDHYLKMYHDSFSACLSELGSNASKLFPFDTLKSEWIEHCKFGFLCANFVFKFKFAKAEDIKEKFEGKLEISPEMFGSLKYDVEKYTKRMIDLVLHLDNIGGL